MSLPPRRKSVLPKLFPSVFSFTIAQPPSLHNLSNPKSGAEPAPSQTPEDPEQIPGVSGLVCHTSGGKFQLSPSPRARRLLAAQVSPSAYFMFAGWYNQFMDQGVVVSDVDLTTVKSRAVKGMATLTGGGIILTLISGIGVLLLTTFLGPKEFGLYGLVGNIIVILGYFSDIGLAASLIQKKDSLTTADLRTTFSIQQVLVTTLVILVLIFSPQIKSYYNLGGPEYSLLLALLASFFISSLKSVPSVMLERTLRFDLIMIVRIVESLTFNSLAVVLAIKGLGVMSYVPAVLAQSLIGLVLIYIFKPWPVGLAFSKDSLKKLLKFGVPYQTNSLLAVAKDQVVNLFLWKIVGASGMGLVNWGFYYSQFPQRLVMDNATKVAFPALSRLQGHPQEFRRSVEKLLQFICLVIFPGLVMIALAWSHLVFLVPKWFKWQPALLPLYLYCFSALLSCLSTPLTNTLYALGKAKIVTYLMIMWLGLEWLLKPTLAIKFGYLGVAIAAAIISISSFVPFFIAKKIIGFSILRSLKTSVLSTLIMLAVGLLVHKFGLIVTVLLSGLAYCLGIVLIGGKLLLADVKPFYTHFRAKI
jgi:O-antigen/teichoic acid export membrane protein